MDLCSYIENILNKPNVTDEQADECLKRILSNYFRNEHLFDKKVVFTTNKLSALKCEIIVDYKRYSEVNYENESVICDLRPINDSDNEMILKILMLNEWGYKLYNNETFKNLLEDIKRENA